MTRTGILLMAYGAPERVDQVEAYYTHIRRGSPPPAELLEELVARYRAIGGGSPLSRIVERQRAALSSELAARGHPLPVYAGMKHIGPFIGDTVRRMVADGVRRIVAIALAPQHSAFNEQTYGRAVHEAAASVAAPAPASVVVCAPAPVAVRVPGTGDRRPAVTVVGSWHDQPRLIDALAAATAEAVARCTAPSRAHVLFTAHSLPERASGGTERYAHEVAATAALVADRLGLERARALNDDPTFIAALADVAQSALASSVAA